MSDKPAAAQIESFNSPLLTQSFCSALCADLDISETQEVTREIPETVELKNIFTEVAGHFGFPIYQRLSRGPQARSGRVTRRFKDDSEGDIYQAILKAVASTGPNAALTYDEIRGALRDILRSDPPQKHEVVRACKQIATISRDSLSKERDAPVSWDAETDTLHITDPFLLFFMKWQVKNS